MTINKSWSKTISWFNLCMYIGVALIILAMDKTKMYPEPSTYNLILMFYCGYVITKSVIEVS